MVEVAEADDAIPRLEVELHVDGAPRRLAAAPAESLLRALRDAGVTTVEFIQSLREELEYKGATAGTFVSYEKQWKRIAAAFPRLPEDQAPLLGG